MDGLALLVDAGGAGNQQNRRRPQIEAHAAGKRTRPGIIVGLVQHIEVRDLLFLNGLGFGVKARSSFQVRKN